MKTIIAIMFSILFTSTAVCADSSDNTTYKKPPLAIIKSNLTPLQFNVTQEEGTEPPFRNVYWDNHQNGIYVDIVTGEPLFSSFDKYDSGTGWPSFTKTIDKDMVILKTDSKLLFSRTEVRSKYGNSHLGHLFNDGPAPTGHRYCMNSAALRFVPVSQMKKQGYGKYLSLFITDVKKQKQDNSFAIFAGGCFWSMQRAFDEVPGVLSTTVGYAGGRKSNPSYKEVCTGKTGHAEAVQVVYDPEKVTYSKLLEVFWSHVDPTDSTGQFCDKGNQYRSEIFVVNDEQKSLANISALEMSKKYKRALSTKITIASKFFPAETEHQSYYKKHPIEYEIYRTGCGRDRRLEELKKMQK